MVIVCGFQYGLTRNRKPQTIDQKPETRLSGLDKSIMEWEKELLSPNDRSVEPLGQGL